MAYSKGVLTVHDYPDLGPDALVDQLGWQEVGDIGALALLGVDHVRLSMLLPMAIVGYQFASHAQWLYQLSEINDGCIDCS